MDLAWHETRRLRSSDTRLKLRFQLQDQKSCASYWGSFGMNVTDNMRCAAPWKGEACGTFSGDPLVCETHDGRGHQYLCGLVSWGLANSSKRRPRPTEVFTDVSKFHDWIHKHMETVWQDYQCKVLKLS